MEEVLYLSEIWVRNVCSPNETHASHLSLNSISAYNKPNIQPITPNFPLFSPQKLHKFHIPSRKKNNNNNKNWSEKLRAYAKESEESDAGEIVGIEKLPNCEGTRAASSALTMAEIMKTTTNTVEVKSVFKTRRQGRVLRFRWRFFRAFISHSLSKLS